MRKLLIIDGNYFAQRVLGQLNMNGTNNLETEKEIKEFNSNLHKSLLNLYLTFNNEKRTLIDNILFVCDYGSWRKNIKPFRPYYIPEDSDIPLNYKENRKAKKEESPINFDNFYSEYSKFVDEISKTVIVFKIYGLEGDDNIMLISNKLKSEKDTVGIVFATDGDLEQTVRDNVVLLKNVRSKTAPNGEFVINTKTYSNTYSGPASAVDAILKTKDSELTSYYKQLFSIQVGDTQGTNKIERKINTGISIAQPFKIALTKSFAGDKKDNIFSTISWMSSTGTRRYSITEKHIEKALKEHGYQFTNETCAAILSSKEQIYQMMLALREVTKQEDVDIDNMSEHLRHNMRMNMLIPSVIPPQFIEEFDKVWLENYHAIKNKTLSQEDFRNVIVTSGTNIFNEAIPEEL